MERTQLSKAVAWALLSSGLVLSGAAYSAEGRKDTPSAPERAQPRDDRARSERQAAQQQGERFWASDLIGKNVAISGGSSGEIKDVIVNTQTGEVRDVVTEIDTDQGKDRLYAIPARMFQPGRGNKLTVNVGQTWLAQRKSWTDDKWPALQDPGYWGDERAPAQERAAAPRGKETTPASAAGDGVHRLSKLIGQNVRNAQGKQVGEIQDAVVNLKSQKVDFVLLGYDPGVTKAEKEYAVPLAAFKFPPAAADGGEGRQPIVLSMSEDRLKGMKPLENADKKRINDPAFISRFQTQ